MTGALPASTPVPRLAARILAVGPGDVLLLLQMRTEPGNSRDLCWITPGGGIHPGEQTADAAARELAEETGIRVRPADLGPVVAYCSGQWSAAGTVYAAHDSFFYVRVPDLRVDASGQEDLERSLITGHRWWNAADLASTQERIIPPGLPGLLNSLLAAGPPASPLQLPWQTVGA
jgi:8-oxo-dGTP pyrophosphatase MutT (NUDIX family)